MGLSLRTASAKLWLAALAAGLIPFVSSPAFAVMGCGFPPTQTLTSGGTYPVASNEVFEIIGDPETLFTFVGSGAPTIDVTTTGMPTSSIIFKGSYRSVCFEGETHGSVTVQTLSPFVSDDWSISVLHQGIGDVVVDAGVMHGDVWGVLAEQRNTATIGNISVVARGDIILSGGGINTGTGITARHGGIGNVSIETLADVDAFDAAIDVDRSGDEGNISIITANRTTLKAQNGVGFIQTIYAPTSLGGSMGLRAVRTAGKGSISITNSANIAAGYVGIHAELCGCDDGDISIVSTGNILIAGVPTGFGGFTNGVGIGALSEAIGTVTIKSSGNITAPDFGIYVNHDGDEGDVFVETAVGSAITVSGGDGGTSGITGIAAFRGAGFGATSGNLTIINGAYIQADDVGIEADLVTLSGDLMIVSTGEIEASSFGIDAYHGGLEGDISIVTVAGTTITAQSGQAPIYPSLGDIGPIGIYALREFGSAGGISIINGASIRADFVGIYADVCGCSGNGTVRIVSSGDIAIGGVMALDPFGVLPPFGPIGAGIYAANDGDVVVRITDGDISGPAGTYIYADQATLEIGANASINTAGTVSGYNAGVLLNTLVGADVFVAGSIAAPTYAILFGDGDNTLGLLPGFSITGLVVGGSGTNALTLGGASGLDTFDLASVDTQYVGFSHNLKKTGGSTWTLADSSSSFSGSFTADAGKLVVNSTIAGLDITLIGTGAIGGSGSFKSLTATGGILAPGNSIGTLTIGTVNVAGIVYQVETNAAGASDKVIVTGTATIDAATSSVLAMPETGAYAKSTTYTILTAGTLNGGFGSVTTASPLFLASLTQDTNAIYLTLTRNVAGVGVTPNQKATGTGLDSFTTSPPYFANLMALPSAQIPAALSAMSGDGYASLMTALITDQRYLREAVLDRLTAVRFTPKPIIVPGFASDLDLTGLETPRVWGRAYGGLSAIAGDGNGPGLSRGAGELVAGADADSGDIHAGVVAATGASTFAIPDRNMSGNSGELSVGAYGDAEWDQFYASLGATLTGQAISTTRTATFAGVNDTYTAQYGAISSQGFGEIGYRIETGATTLAPFAGLALVNTTTSGFAETGTGPGALTVAASSVSAAITTFGVRLEHQFVISDDMLVTLSGSAAWRHAFGGQGATSNAFAGGAPFTVLGAPLAADQILVTAGADIDVSEDLAVGIAYSGAFGSGSHALHATVSGYF